MIPGLSLAGFTWPARLAVAAVALVAAGATGWHYGVRNTLADWNAERAASAEVAAESQRMARITETRRQEGAADALNAYAARTRQSQAAAVGAATELERLRGTIYAIAPSAAASDPEAAGRADDLARARIVVGRCAEALSAVSAAADTCEGRLSGLQEWVKAATQP